MVGYIYTSSSSFPNDHGIPHQETKVSQQTMTSFSEMMAEFLRLKKARLSHDPSKEILSKLRFKLPKKPNIQTCYPNTGKNNVGFEKGLRGTNNTI